MQNLGLLLLVVAVVIALVIGVIFYVMMPGDNNKSNGLKITSQEVLKQLESLHQERRNLQEKLAREKQDQKDVEKRLTQLIVQRPEQYPHPRNKEKETKVCLKRDSRKLKVPRRNGQQEAG